MYFLLLSVLYLLLSQKTEKVKGTAQVEFPDNLTRQEVKRQAEEQATIDALERAFGQSCDPGQFHLYF